MTDTITLTGNIATIPEHKKILEGVPVTSFRLATSHRRLDRATGQWVDGETSYYTVQLFRQLAEHAVLSLSRGDRVIVTGRLKVREWDNGTRRGTTVELEADAIGHDLKFGTSRFTRSTASRPAGDAASAEGWAAPGVPAETTAEPPTDGWATSVPGSGEGSAESDAADADSPASVLSVAGERPF
ncbi:single-stranded DNA-binding protein [Microbacterium sp. ET2]|uniref:single-stranded DNA-binding protein n=1 Tax=Microbacterium albipurpureum TaxID=3050384 RepID=UPI00259D2F96|nr:single-stranded DNA-binding protein [Microbacterium sp. ET2 (Ac-2212)]WJL95731.1 single-stranded DNA-binding protein [Microbacterium sp. ET2 (Ac-2212)]